MPYRQMRRAYPVQSIPSPNSHQWQNMVGLLGAQATDSSQRLQTALGDMSQLASIGMEQAVQSPGISYFDQLQAAGQQRRALDQLISSIGAGSVAETASPEDMAAFNSAQKRSTSQRMQHAARDKAKILENRDKFSTAQINEALGQWATRYADVARSELSDMDLEQLQEFQQKAKLDEIRAETAQWYADLRSGKDTAPPLFLNEKGIPDVPPGLNETFRIMSLERQAERDRVAKERAEARESRLDSNADRAARDREFKFEEQQLKTRFQAIEQGLEGAPASELAKMQRAYMQERRALYDRIYSPQAEAAPETPPPRDLVELAESKGVTDIVMSDADYLALPSGTRFLGADGKLYRKP